METLVAGSPSCTELPALAGHRVGVTADRRAEEQAELLRRHGAEVSFGPVMRTLPLGDDSPLRSATDELLRAAPTTLLLTTGIGVRSWLGAAEAWGLADDLLALLERTAIYARGPKAYAAAMQAGLSVWRREPTERLGAMVETLIQEGVAGQHIAIQLYGEAVPWAVQLLEEAGARVTCVPIYRWVRPDDVGPARRLVREAIDGHLTAVTFTCPAAVANTCRIAEEDGLLDDLLHAFEHRVAAACCGPVTATAARDHGITVACAPAVGRLGLLVRALSTTLLDRHLHLWTPAGEVLVQGDLVVTAEQRVELADRERHVLAVLARRAGMVVPRPTIEREVWGIAGDRGALDAVLSRLRRHLAPTGLAVTTRVRRGYQLEARPLRCPLEHTT